MTKPTAYSAQVKAVRTWLGGSKDRVSLAKLQKRLDNVRLRKGIQDTLIDREGAMVLLALPWEKVKDLTKFNPPAHPFKTSVVERLPKLKNGRPSAKVSAERKRLVVKRGRGKPPEEATVAEVLDWAEALVEAGYLKNVIGTWNKDRGPDYTIDMTKAKVPFLLIHDKVRVSTTVLGQLVGYGQMSEALRNPKGRFLRLMTMENALLDCEWADTALQQEISEVYAEHLEQRANIIRDQVAQRIRDNSNQSLQSRTPPARGKPIIRRP